MASASRWAWTRGSPRNGWYGGAFTFYTGDVTQQLPRATRTNTQWYMLTGYTDWRGKHVFLDTQLERRLWRLRRNPHYSVSATVFRDRDQPASGRACWRWAPIPA